MFLYFPFYQIDFKRVLMINKEANSEEQLTIYLLVEILEIRRDSSQLDLHLL